MPLVCSFIRKFRRVVRISSNRYGVAGLVIAVVTSVALATAHEATAQGGQATPVLVDAVRQEAVTQTTPVIGRVVARQSGVVAARISGPVAAMQVSVGDRVEAGQVIALLNQDTLHWQHQLRAAEVSRAQAVLQNRQIQVERLELDLSRLERLRNSPAFGQARYDDIRKEVTQAHASLAEAAAARASAQANLELADIALREAEIRAPYAGVITQRHSEVGAYVAVGQPLYTLINDRNLEIEADVPSRRIVGVFPGATVSVSLDQATRQQAPPITLTATVRAAVPEENTLTRTRIVRFHPNFEAAALGLAVNQSLTVNIPVTNQREAITLSKDAVVFSQGRTIVFVVEDDTAKPRPITLGEPVGDRFEVAGGVKLGDLVVVRGNERLRPGQAVSILPQ